VLAAVDIDVPYSPPPADADSDFDTPIATKPKAKPKAPKGLKELAAKPAALPPPHVLPPPPAPVPRVPLAVANKGARPAAAVGQKRKLLDAGPVDALPMSFMMDMLGGFQAPKVKGS